MSEKPLLWHWDAATKRIGELRIAQWCRYWEVSSDQPYEDGLDIPGSVRAELADAADVIMTMAALLDAAGTYPEWSPDFACDTIDGRKWRDIREELTGKPWCER